MLERGEDATPLFMDILNKLFEKHFNVPAELVRPLRGQLGASDRKLFRLSRAEHTAIGVLYDSREENKAFVEFSRHFRRHGLPVPEIYAEELRRGAYLEEDLGDLTLYQFLAAHRSGADVAPEVVEGYRKVVAILPRFQVEGGRDLNYKASYPRASFDRQSIAWDLNYFKYYFLRLSGTPFNEQRLENDFRRLTGFLLKAGSAYFLYRDFQSRNIMLRNGEPYFLDYQGGRRGALQYDIASLLFDAKADLPPELRQHLLEAYLDELGKHITLDRDEFLRYYYAFVYVRIMQAMGAYGFRGLYERKTHFLQSVPYALANVQWLLNNTELPIKVPELMKSFRLMVSSDTLQSVREPERLTVRVSSFSFHRGVPQDNSGHGGGFVFDARGLPNPGREERFKSITGRDRPVIEYLDRYDSVHQYLAHAVALVDASVANYKERGFKHLSVAFGCTGGQHRSVYLAEALAKHLREQDGMDVQLRHRELENLT
jgi:aminoglycoside/choline kinase family phosphotransferase